MWLMQAMGLHCKKQQRDNQKALQAEKGCLKWVAGVIEQLPTWRDSLREGGRAAERQSALRLRVSHLTLHA